MAYPAVAARTGSSNSSIVQRLFSSSYDLLLLRRWLENGFYIGRIGAKILFYVFGIGGIAGALDDEPAAPPLHFYRVFLLFSSYRSAGRLQPYTVFVGAMDFGNAIATQSFQSA